MLKNVKKHFEVNKYLLLLVSLLLFFILSSLIAESTQNKITLGILFSIVLVFSTYIIAHEKYLIYAASTLAVIALIGNWSSTFAHANFQLIIFNDIISTLFFAFITVMTLSYVMRDKVINSATLYGAICGYLLVGLTWSFLYLIIATLDPQAFNTPEVHSLTVYGRLKEYLYYSFVCLSTMGFGDIVPISAIARTMSWLEAVTGQIYLTVLIARLVGLYIVHQGKK